jgi:hypothetical protein
MLGEVIAGVPHAHEAVWIRLVLPRTEELRRVRVIPRARHAVDVGERLPLRRVGDDDEVPALAGAGRRRLERQREALLDHGERHRTREVEPSAHGAGGGEHTVDRRAFHR